MDTSTVLTDGQRGCLTRIREREEAAFRARVPKSLALGSKARKAMPSGVPALDGRLLPDPDAVGRPRPWRDVHGRRWPPLPRLQRLRHVGDPRLRTSPLVTQVIGEQAARGVQMFLPDESALAVCDQLRMRFGLPMWQFALLASSANAEALRIARVATGRQVLLFGGKYHGMLEETLWSDDGTGLVPEELGVGTAAPPDLAVVDFNDLDAAERVLRLGRTAAVLIEGVLTNCGTVLPEDGFLPGLREACRDRHVAGDG